MRAHTFQHVAFEGLGSIEQWLRQNKFAVTRTRQFAGDPPPDPHTIDFLIVMGGPMGANDEARHPWLAEEKRVIRAVMDAGKPVIGICLGAQLIAAAMGARVFRNPEKEIGWWPVEGAAPPEAPPAAATDTFLFPPVIEAFHWHGDTFDLPEGAVRLASSEACQNQAFQLGRRVIGLQFHLEVTRESVAALVSNCRDELVGTRWVQSAEEMLLCPDRRFTAAHARMRAVLDHLRMSEHQPALSLSARTVRAARSGRSIS